MNLFTRRPRPRPQISPYPSYCLCESCVLAHLLSTPPDCYCVVICSNTGISDSGDTDNEPTSTLANAVDDNVFIHEDVPMELTAVADRPVMSRHPDSNPQTSHPGSSEPPTPFLMPRDPTNLGSAGHAPTPTASTNNQGSTAAARMDACIKHVEEEYARPREADLEEREAHAAATSELEAMATWTTDVESDEELEARCTSFFAARLAAQIGEREEGTPD